MKPGTTVKQIHSGRFIKVVNIDDYGINKYYTSMGVQYEAYRHHIKPLNFFERVTKLFTL